MKNNLLLTILLLYSFTSFSQAHFEGIVTYEMHFQDRDDAEESGKSDDPDRQLPKEFTLYVHNSQTRLEISAGQSNVTVIGTATDSVFTLMEIMGRKIALKTDATQMKAAQDHLGRFRLVHLEGKREILGYDCGKALLIHEESGDSSEVWYTSELPPIKVASGEFLPRMEDYFPMEINARKDGTQLSIRVREIELTPVERELFEIPAGYKIVDVDGLRQGLQLLMAP